MSATIYVLVTKARRTSGFGESTEELTLACLPFTTKPYPAFTTVEAARAWLKQHFKEWQQDWYTIQSIELEGESE